MHKTERDAIDGFSMLDHHVKTVLSSKRRIYHSFASVRKVGATIHQSNARINKKSHTHTHTCIRH